MNVIHTAFRLGVLALLASQALLAQNASFPNEVVYYPPSRIPVPTDLGQFAASSGIAFLGVLEAKTGEFADATQATLVTRFDFRITEVFKGSLSVGQLVSLSIPGGTFLVLPDGTRVPRQLAPTAQFMLLDRTFFAAGVDYAGRYWTRPETIAELVNDSAIGLAGLEWTESTVTTGRAQILALSPSATPSDRESFLHAIRSAFAQ